MTLRKELVESYMEARRQSLAWLNDLPYEQETSEVYQERARRRIGCYIRLSEAERLYVGRLIADGRVPPLP